MRKFLAGLFAMTPAARTARLSLDAMEDRYAPAVLVNPGTIRGFNLQPEPPGNQAVVIRTAVEPTDRTLTSAAGNTTPGASVLAAHGFNPQPEPPGDAGIIAIRSTGR